MVIKRSMLPELEKHLTEKEISMIVGPRQAGKTTLMLWLKNKLDGRGKSTLYLNLDYDSDKKFFTTQQTLINKIELELQGEGGYVFIDEIQRKEDAGLFFKGIYDMNLSYKFILSGSGSYELKEKVHESLAGRKRIFHLTTLSFEEFVNYKTDYKYENRLQAFFEIEEEKTFGLLKEYMNYGGYPAVVVKNTSQEKLQVIKEVYQSFVEKDLIKLLSIEKSEVLGSLLKLIAGQIGQITNYSEISNTLDVSVKTVKNYLWYLEKTYILQAVSPYFRNVRKEITKSPVYYFEDLGMRNFVLEIFGNIEKEPNQGFLFQNFILNFFIKPSLKLSPSKPHFWRTKDKSEVDFIIEKGLETIPVETKFSTMKKPEITRSLRNFIDKYKPKKAIVVNLSLDENIKIKTTEVFLVPYYKLHSLLLKETF